MVTAEIAVGLLLVALVSSICVFTIGLVIERTRCADAASAVARQVARGDSQAARLAEMTAPRGASLTRTTSSTSVTVACDVTRSMGSFGPFHLHAQATAVLEPGVQR